MAMTNQSRVVTLVSVPAAKAVPATSIGKGELRLRMDVNYNEKYRRKFPRPSDSA